MGNIIPRYDDSSQVPSMYVYYVLSSVRISIHESFCLGNCWLKKRKVTCTDYAFVLIVFLNVAHDDAHKYILIICNLFILK